jgi:deoxyribodipyrimidine photolyase-related protein
MSFTEEIQKSTPRQTDEMVYIHYDQLNVGKWQDVLTKDRGILFVESVARAASKPFHKKKLIFEWSAQRHFARSLIDAGFEVTYLRSDLSVEEAIREFIESYKVKKMHYRCPSELDPRVAIRKLGKEDKTEFKEWPDNFFVADHEAYKDNIKPGYRMEYFYRDMRRQTGYLMNGEEPEGGEWNYDEENRKKLPKNHPVPTITSFEPDEITREVLEEVEELFPDHIGSSEGFGYAVTREQALQLLNEFIDERLDEFGPYEDALALDEPFIFHSTLSAYMNIGLLDPIEVCDAAQQAYDEGKARLNSVEGFIRQIIGWREFVKVYYEAMMPDVREANYFNFTEELPDLYWSGDTEMKCMSECVKPVLEHAYSHHIPRLMVLSNFSNLTRTDPRQLNEWFWFSYIDAYEWVVLPNVLGMSTFADGGVLASKPYAAGGNYVNKMSNYCSKCSYKIKEKTGEKACPFNYLYWNFVDEQRDTFMENGRANFMVNMFDKKSEEEKKAIRESSDRFISGLKRYTN